MFFAGGAEENTAAGDLSFYSDELLVENSVEYTKFKQPESAIVHDSQNSSEIDSDGEPQRPVKCQICSKRFSTKKHLSRHQRRVHPKYWNSSDRVRPYQKSKE